MKYLGLLIVLMSFQASAQNFGGIYTTAPSQGNYVYQYGAPSAPPIQVNPQPQINLNNVTIPSNSFNQIQPIAPISPTLPNW